jgi:hypothetical protein
LPPTGPRVGTPARAREQRMGDVQRAEAVPHLAESGMFDPFERAEAGDLEAATRDQVEPAAVRCEHVAGVDVDAGLPREGVADASRRGRCAAHGDRLQHGATAGWTGPANGTAVRRNSQTRGRSLRPASGSNKVMVVITRSFRLAVVPVLLALAACSGAPPRPDAAPDVVVPPARPAATALGPRLAASALRHLGVPYRYGGEDPEGFDCSGLVWYVHREAGLPVPRTAAEQRARATPVRREELRPGDLVFFSSPRDHVGIYLGGGEFVHAPATGRRVERARLDAPFFILGFAGAGRFTPGG